MMSNEKLNKIFMRIPKRSEGVDRLTLVQTFVDLDPLVTLLSTKDHQVVYGRRGTGKTHALLYVSETLIDQGDICIYIDMRTVGSSGGIYSDVEIPTAERGTRLLIDTLENFHESLLNQILSDEQLDLSQLGPRLDALAEAITQVRVAGTIERAQSEALEQTEQSSSATGANIGAKGASAESKSQYSAASTHKADVRTTEKGTLRHRVHFGSLTNALIELVRELKGPRKNNLNN